MTKPLPRLPTTAEDVDGPPRLSVPGQRWVGNVDTSSVWATDDQGQRWTEVLVPESTGCVHMNIVPRSDGTLWACFRSRWADFIYESTSQDGGRTWRQPSPTVMPNNNSSIQCTTLGDGAMALTFNNSSRADATERRVSLYDEIDDEGISDSRVQRGIDESGTDGNQAFWGAPRAPLTLGFSVDDGRSWPVRWDLATGDGYCMTNNSRDGLNRELSYPSVTPGPDGDLHVTFTHHRKAIRYIHVPADVLAKGLAEAGREDGR